MSKVTIYHNPRCSKSRQTLSLLEEHGVTPVIIRYLETPPTTEELGTILSMLGMAPRDLMRNKEAPFGELGLADDSKSDEELINAMVANPVLIERPIVVANGRAAIGRPPEQVLSLL